MNFPLRTLLLLALIVLLHASAFGQSVIPVSTEETGGPPAVTNTAEQVKVLQERKSLLQQRLYSAAPGSRDHSILTDWIQEIGAKIDQLKSSAAAVSSSPSSIPTAIGASAPSTVRTKPDFELSVPIDGATNENTTLQLAWTEDRQLNKTYNLQKFIVEVGDSDERLANGRLSRTVFVNEDVKPEGESGQGVNVPKEILRSGHKYYWQVLAVYTQNDTGAEELVAATNATESPQNFRTLAQTFEFFERKGLTLQRAVSGDDATEGAQFGFLRTFNEQTVYTADFALIYHKRLKSTQRTGFAFQTSVQGNLTSAETQSEDAVQFRAGAIIDRNLKRDTINHLYISLAAKYEADQKFRVGKFISENMLTPTFPALGIGIPFGRSSDPIQFRWRPYFYFDVGHSYKNGTSAEAENTVLRFTPRIRTMLTLNFLRRALNLNDTFIFADDYLYYLPLEQVKTRYNMFTSGFVLQVTKDFGFGLTYKNGEAAPKFKPVHSLGGVLTIRFGKED